MKTLALIIMILSIISIVNKYIKTRTKEKMENYFFRITNEFKQYSKNEYISSTIIGLIISVIADLIILYCLLK